MDSQHTPHRPLIVIVPALKGGFEGWRPLLARLEGEDALRGATWLLLPHDLRWYGFGNPAQVAVRLRARVDQEWRKSGPYSEVMLVGHSFGGLLVRAAYLLACGADHAVRERSEWADRVSRIILLAAVNRGVDPTRLRGLRYGHWLTRALPVLRRLVIAQVFKGSSFITNLRIQWIRHFDRLGEGAPVVVQLLGTEDRLVTSEDSVDVEQFQNAFYIRVPDATHGDLHCLDGAPDPDGRYALLRDAFVNTKPVHGENRTFDGAGRVVFVLHGIRANNRTWVKQTIDAIKSRWPEVEPIGEQYGYISALQFAVPMLRRRNLTWFQDAYSQALAHNPRATFDFIGHSNGTYLFGESLREIPGMQFDRAVLVGSVLPSDYDWARRAEARQITMLRVDGSRFDWPVAWLCSALRGIGMKDVGTGGYDGFTSVGPEKHEYFWYRGGHSEPLAPRNLPALAEYAVTGVPASAEDLDDQPVAWFAVVSRALRRLPHVAVVAALLLLAVAAGVPTTWVAATAVVAALVFAIAVM